jgi:hypothetical protein
MGRSRWRRFKKDRPNCAWEEHEQYDFVCDKACDLVYLYETDKTYISPRCNQHRSHELPIGKHGLREYSWDEYLTLQVLES